MSQLKIIVKVDDTTSYTFLETNNLIEGVSIARKMDSDIKALVSEIECGEVNIQMSNLFNDFNTTSATAKYSKLKNGQSVKIYNITDTTTTLLFTGFLVDFKAPTSSKTQSCSLRVVDRLHYILNSEITSTFTVDSDITLSAYVTLLFTAFGLTADEYVIDTSLADIILSYSLITGYKLAEQLNNICKAIDAYIYVDKAGILQVKPKEITGIATTLFNRESKINCLENSEFGASILSSYNCLKVGYVATKQSEVKEVLKLASITAKPGITAIENYALETGNLYELDSIKVTSSADVVVSSVSATSSTITLTLKNDTTVDEIVSVAIYGKVIETAESYIIKTVESEQTVQTLEVSSILVQSKAYAESLANKLYARASLPLPYITADVTVIDFTVDLGDIVRIQDTEADLDYTGYIHSIDIEYDGQGYSYYNLGIKYVEEVA